jgi:hypothetical protein
MMDEARYARGPALLRFSAAHEARPRQTGRSLARAPAPPFACAFAVTVVVLESNGPVFGPSTIDVA